MKKKIFKLKNKDNWHAKLEMINSKKKWRK